MLKKPRLLSHAFVVLLCTFSISVLSIPALASSHTTGAASPAPETKTFLVPASSAAETLPYWTAERMRAATPVDVLAGKVNKPAIRLPKRPVGKPGETAAVAPQHLHSSTVVTRETRLAPQDYPFPYERHEITADYTQWPYDVEGRIFFVDPQTKQGHSCSGTVLNSNNKSVVDTAGHCVITAGSHNNWFTNWVFCPAYKDGNCQLGKWTPRLFKSVTYWTDKGWTEYDFGAAVMNPDSNGNPIVNVLGGEAASWNYPRNQFFSALGYPADPPFDGNRLYECDSQYATDLDFGTGLPMMGIGCDLTGGSSGGPWYRDFTANGGYRNGHNDWKLTEQPEAMYSPYYGNDWHDLVFDPAQNA